jgi:hypothetical protein
MITSYPLLPKGASQRIFRREKTLTLELAELPYCLAERRREDCKKTRRIYAAR